MQLDGGVEVPALDSVLLYGGSFDPIHHGHLIVSRYVAENLHIQRVILIPGASPPHKHDQTLTAAGHRLAMCRLAADRDDLFDVSAWETGQPGPNYSLLTVRHFHETLGPAVAVHWLIGMDSLHELGTWFQATELVDACTIVTTARPGFEPPAPASLAKHFSPAQVDKLRRNVIDGPRIDIAGTDIRARVRAGRSVRYLVPESVAQYIGEHGLYR